MHALKKLIQEIHRRSLWQVLGIYVVGGWAALEAIGGIAETAGLPGWLPSMALVLLILGLPMVLATAFVQEGMRGQDAGTARRESAEARPTDLNLAAGTGSLDRPRSKARTSERIFTWRNAFLGGLGAFALWGLVATALLLAGGPTAGADEGAGDASPSVAVLPFTNLSADEEDRYFADGVHEEILAQLTKIGDLKPISRTSVMAYRAPERNLREIADELGVRYVLEGSVRRFEERVRITAQLIDASSDTHLWAENYERPREDLFAIQAEVAVRIAEALRAELTPEERARIVGAPTESERAHDLYLRGLDYWRRGDAAGRTARGRQWSLSEGLLEDAVEEDPAFALAWALLARVHESLFWFGFDRSEERADRARRAAARARELAPGSGEAHEATGWILYHVDREYEGAAREGRLAAERLPGQASVWLLLGSIERRRGRFEAAAEDLARGGELDPRNPVFAQELGSTFHALGRPAEAERSLEEAIRLAPDWSQPYRDMAWGHLRSGDLEAAERVLARWDRGGVGPDSELTFLRYRLALLRGEPEEALAALETLDGPDLDHQDWIMPVAYLRGEALRRQGRTTEAEGEFRAALERLEVLDRERPGYYAILRNLARAQAALGILEAAGTADRARRALPVEVDPFEGPTLVEDEALVYLDLGYYEGALAALEELAALGWRYQNPGLTPPQLVLDPRWDPVRDDPAFRAIVAAWEG